MIKDVEKNIEYEIVDFKGCIPWIKWSDIKYTVDPLHLEEFLKTF
jgi:hypothetical protein